MKISCLFFTISCCIALVAQKTVSFSGIVFDPQTNIPINNFHVGILEHPEINVIGTKDGYFSLRVPEELKNDTFFISSVGYKLYKASVASILKNSSPGTPRIALKPIKTYLNRYLNGDSTFQDSQVFTDNKVLGKEVILKVKENIKYNYDSTKFKLNAYWREVKYEDNAAVKLYEGLVAIIDTGYGITNPSRFEEIIQVEALRESEDFSNGKYLEENGLALVLMVNDVRYPDNLRLNIFSSLDKFDYHLDSIFYYKNELCYHITLSNKPEYPRIAGGTFIIRCDDYGLLFSDYFLRLEQKGVVKTYKAIQVKYQEFNEKLYPEYIRLEHCDNTVGRNKEISGSVKQIDELFIRSIEDNYQASIPKPSQIIETTDLKKAKLPSNLELFKQFKATEFARSNEVTEALNKRKPLDEQFLLMSK